MAKGFEFFGRRHLAACVFLALAFSCGGALAAVEHSATSGAHVATASAAGKLAWEHAVLPGDGRILVVTTALHSNAGATVTEVTYNGSALTRKASANPYFAEEVQLWYQLAPSVGVGQVEVSYSRGHSGLEARATTYTGVNPYRPFSSVVTSGGRSAGPATASVGSADGELVIDALAYQNGGTMGAGAGQTERYSQRDPQNGHAASERAGAAPAVTMSWALQAYDTWAMVAASLQPAGAPAVRTVSVRPSCAGYADCYGSLNEAVAAEAGAGSLVARDLRLDIELYAMADTAKVDLRPLSGLTDARHYVRIYTPASERHQGAWDPGRYHLDVAATVSPGRASPECVLVGSADVWLDGIQLRCSSPCTNYPAIVTVDAGSAASTFKVSNSILRGSFSGAVVTDTSGFRVSGWPAAAEAYVWNTVVQDLVCSGGPAGRMLHTTSTLSGRWWVTNVTLHNAAKGLSVSGLKVHVRNSIANAMTGTGWTGCAPDSDYNLTNLNESITGARSRSNANVLFLDAAGGDLRLSSADTVAVDAGQSLLNSPAVNDGLDIAGEPRDALWDIGAAEAMGAH